MTDIALTLCDGTSYVARSIVAEHIRSVVFRRSQGPAVAGIISQHKLHRRCGNLLQNRIRCANVDPLLIMSIHLVI